MDLKRKLARLSSAGPGPARGVRAPETVEVPPLVHPLEPDEPARSTRIAELRGRIRAMMARPADDDAAVAGPPVDREAALAEALPFAREHTALGALRSRARYYDAAHQHGLVPLRSALDARGDAVHALALDASLRGFDASSALYLDTETTGLAGGTGTLAFLVGLGRFDAGRFCVEQVFLGEPCDEPALLARVAERIAGASALVTFNGKTFDLPLLRSRFVLARMPPPAEPPHLDLFHVARRVYRARIERCRLGAVERDVLGFERVGDVPSSEIPARYVHWLRAGDAQPLAAVVDHNLLDVVAMAALVGELAARATGGRASGLFDPSDMASMARAAMRAGATALATSLAEQAAEAGMRAGRPVVAAQARALAATLHLRRGDHHATRRALLGALELTPLDAEVHLRLAKLYEHRLRDPERALEHARRGGGAEEATEHARRLERLETRVSRTPLRLPGIA